MVARALRLLAVGLGLTAFPPKGMEAQRSHVVRGRVVSDSGQVIPAADIIVTVAPSAHVIAAVSDSTGHYRIVIPAGDATGEYILYVGAIGRRPFRQRVTLAGADSAIVDATLASAVATIGAIRVQAQAPRPPRSLGTDAGPPVGDGLNRRVDGVVNALPPDLQGNFEALASLVPGLAVTTAGVSAVGLSGDANLTTLNGMAFGATSLPRDLATTTTFFTSPWDPTRGGFSGVLTSASVNRGSNIRSRRARLTLDAPALQAGDDVAEQFGQQYTNVQVGSAESGAFSLDKYFYNYGVQASRQTAKVSSLLDLDAAGLAHAGIAADSALALTQILTARGIPLSRSGIPRHRTTTSVQFVSRFDRALPVPAARVTPPPTWNVIVGADYAESAAMSLGPTVLPATTGEARNASGFLQGQYSTYFGPGGRYINETATGFAFRDSRSDPFLSIPGGEVLLASDLDRATPTIGALSFGGNGLLARRHTAWSWEINNQTGFLVKQKSSFPAKLYLQSRYESYDQSMAANRLGTFTFESLDALRQNAPSAFTRTLSAPDRSGGQWLGALALGGSWNSPRLVLSGGARVDANVFVGRPSLNDALRRTFGVENDRSPSSVAVSPRFGFNWYPTAQSGPGMFFSPVATTYRTGYQIRGGIGQFRSFLPATLLADAIGMTGMRGSAQRLVCTGGAVPIPDWQAYLNDPTRAPSSCAGEPSIFADTAPSVTLVDRSFTPMRTWRFTVGWTNTIKNNYIAVDGVYALNLDQPGTIDLNFDGTPRFELADEGRAVFVPESNIVPTTGGLSAVESRRSSSFGRVTRRVSDLRGDARQLSIYLIPGIPLRFGFLSLGYTYTDARSQFRGFDGAAASDPRRVEWASQSFSPRHQLVAQGAKLLFGGTVALSVSGRVMSGVRFTPLVAGDVNGDGSSGDRAFIFDPSLVADAEVASGLHELLQRGSATARRCLRGQISSMAGRNSCLGPWSATMNASLFMPSVPRTNGRVQASLNIANPLAGIDQLLHGNNPHGWGSTPVIDPSLYRVRGFDPVERRFTYQVNPRFGSAMPANAALHTPFRITLDVRVQYGRSAEEQRLEQTLRLRPPLVGTRAPADSIKRRYASSAFTGLYTSLLRLADSLALSRDQAEQIRAHERDFVRGIDSVYGSLADYLAALPADYDVSVALKRVNAAHDAAWKLIYAEAPYLRQLLSPGQIRLLPVPLRTMLTTNLRGRFFF